MLIKSFFFNLKAIFITALPFLTVHERTYCTMAFKQANRGAYSNPGTLVVAQNKDFGTVSQTELSFVCSASYIRCGRCFFICSVNQQLLSLSLTIYCFIKRNSIDKQDSTGARQIEVSGSDNQSLSGSSTPIIPSISNKSIKPPAACSNTGARLGSVRTVAETATATVITLVHPISSPSVAIGNVTLSVSFKIYISFTIEIHALTFTTP